MNEFRTLTLKEIICKFSRQEVQPDIIVDDTNLVEDLLFDSLTFIELISEIESTFDINIDSDDLDFDVLNIYKGLHSIVDLYLSKASQEVKL
jgi:acyl carrier protein